MKVCCRCKKEKDESEFYRRASRNGALFPECKECTKEKAKIDYYEKGGKERVREQRRTPKGQESTKKASDKFRASPRGKAYYKEYNKKYSQTEKCKEYRKSERYQKLLADFKEKNKEHKSQQDKEYREWRKSIDIEGWRDHGRTYMNGRYSNDINFRLVTLLRRRTNSAIKRGKGIRCYKSMDLLGCTIQFVREHLEHQWTDNMSWTNYGNGKDNWNIDHYFPCNAFDLTNSLHQRACFNWRNLRPMWYIDNIKKHNHYDQTEFDEYIKWFAANENSFKKK